MALLDLLRMRRDTRHFTDDPLPDYVLEKALEAAHLAPTVGLSEATRFYIIREKTVKETIHALFASENEKIQEKISGETADKYRQLKLQAILDSPAGIIVTTDYSVLHHFTIGVSGTADTLQWSSVCAVQNLWLSLTEQGYSLGWVSILDYHQLKKILGLPAHEFPLGYFCVGKAATDYQNQPMLQQKGWKNKSAHPVVKEIRTLFGDTTTKLTPTPVSDRATHFDDRLGDALTEKINQKTKPIGSLGKLEQIAWQAGMVQHTLSPEIRQPHIVVFAGDHGIAKTGLVNPYPQAVTRQMVQNFLSEGAAINVFCQQHSIGLTIVDAGINYYWTADDSCTTHLVNRKIGYGTANYLEGPAMTSDELFRCIQSGKEIVQSIAAKGCNCIGFGEMGIGNSSSAALLMHGLTGVALEDCIGRGTGVSDEQFIRKISILQKVAQLHSIGTLSAKPLELLSAIGGFEIAMMTGAYLAAVAANMLIVVDGFIATAALLPAFEMDKQILQNCLFAHTSGEKGHQKMLDFLGVDTLLQLDMRLGEGTGAALAMPLVQSAVNFLQQMASFDKASVDSIQS